MADNRDRSASPDAGPASVDPPTIATDIARVDALVELTLIGQAASGFGELASATVARVAESLGAVAGSYGLISPDDRLVDVHSVNLASAFNDWPADRPASAMTSIRRFLDGGGAYVQPYVEGQVSSGSLRSARRFGFSAYAAIPIRTIDVLDGLITVYFDRPPSTIEVHPPTLEAIGRIASVSLANFRLRGQLEASETRYRTMFDASPDAYLLCDLNGTILEANETAGRLFGSAPGDLRGQPALRFLPVDEPERSRRVATLQAQGRGRFGGVARRADGTTFARETETVRVRIGPAEGYFIVVRDVTEQQRLQAELVQAQKMETVGILVSGVAHELNNPIASILGGSELIRRDPALPDELRDTAALVLEEADRAGRIVRTFLDFVRPRQPERHPTPVGPLLETIRELQSYSQKSGVEWTIHVKPNLPKIAIDRSQLQQVLLNLTTNSIQAILSDRPTGHLTLSAERGRGIGGHGSVRILVTDDGPGIPDANRSRLFVPFFTTKEPGEGTGLGLSVSFDIVRRHDGRLSFEPAPGGRGSRFIVELPVAPAQPPARAPERVEAEGQREPASARPPRVLVLDDVESIRRFVGRALEKAGLETVVVADGPTAVALVATDPVDVVLVDHRMAGMTGIEVYREVLAARPEMAGRWIFMSGDVLNPELAEFSKSNGIRLLAKPFDIATVTQTVGEVLDAVGLQTDDRGAQRG